MNAFTFCANSGLRQDIFEPLVACRCSHCFASPAACPAFGSLGFQQLEEIGMLAAVAAPRVAAVMGTLPAGQSAAKARPAEKTAANEKIIAPMNNRKKDTDRERIRISISGKESTETYPVGNSTPRSLAPAFVRQRVLGIQVRAAASFSLSRALGGRTYFVRSRLKRTGSSRGHLR